MDFAATYGIIHGLVGQHITQQGLLHFTMLAKCHHLVLLVLVNDVSDATGNIFNRSTVLVRAVSQAFASCNLCQVRNYIGLRTRINNIQT